MDSMEKKPELRISSAEDFKKKADEVNKEEVVELPSGLVVKIKRPKLSKLLKEKVIPAELINAVYEAADGNGNTKPDLAKSIEFMDRMIAISVVAPTIKENPDYSNGEISIDDLTEDDRDFIFDFVNKVGGSRQSLKTFSK